MKFHLQFPVQDFKNKINYSNKFVFAGSCFAENIGELFLQYKLNSVINSHGIQYNPHSICNALQDCIESKQINESDLFFYNDLWHSWHHHSRFSNVNKEICLANINEQIQTAHHHLKQANWLIITLGSSFVYKNIELNKLVANCHKVPQKQFQKYLFTSIETEQFLEEIIQKLKSFNSQLQIIFTVSPVRYIRDGVVENNLSKARLIDAVHSTVAKHTHCSYFPVYELVIDDLRDYRFFKEDLVHPNELAIKYVFEKFVEHTFDEKSKNILEKVKEINAAKNHRSFSEETTTVKKFKNNFLQKCFELKKEFPFLDLKSEIVYFES